MDPNTLLDVFAGLDVSVMASLAVLAGVLRMSPLPRLLCVVVPMVLGGMWGYFAVLDAVDRLVATPAKIFSAVLLNSMGAVVVGRIAAPVVTRLLWEQERGSEGGGDR